MTVRPRRPDGNWRYPYSLAASTPRSRQPKRPLQRPLGSARPDLVGDRAVALPRERHSCQHQQCCERDTCADARVTPVEPVPRGGQQLRALRLEPRVLGGEDSVVAHGERWYEPRVLRSEDAAVAEDPGGDSCLEAGDLLADDRDDGGCARLPWPWAVDSPLGALHPRPPRPADAPQHQCP